jgi:hypothetical protein
MSAALAKFTTATTPTIITIITKRRKIKKRGSQIK